MQPQIEKQQKENLLSLEIYDKQSESLISSQQQLIPIQKAPQTQKRKTTNQDIINPIQELIKNNNILPLLAIIDKIDLNRKIQDKPLICLMVTKFISLDEVLKNRKVQLTSDQDRRTPLHYAIQANDVKAALWCIQNGNPNQRDNFGITPILQAIKSGRRRCFLLCLKHKFYDQRAPIIAAMYNKHWQLKILHSLKYDIDIVRDQNNKTAFQTALQYCSFDCAQFFIRRNNKIKIQKYEHHTQSKGLIRTLKRIQKQQSSTNQLLSIVYPLTILFSILVGLYANEFNLVQYQLPYKYSSDFYLVLIILILSLYFLMYIFDSCASQQIKYNKKNTISAILNQPNYTAILQNCPICLHFTDHRYDHCYKCQSCVEKFHFHSFVCVHKANQVFWVLVEFIWMYLTYALLAQFNQFILLQYVSLVKFSSIFMLPVKYIASVKLLFQDHKYFSAIFIIFILFLFLYQLFYSFTILSMMCLRRKYQQIIHSQKYQHLYHVVKIQDSYVNQQKRIGQRGLCAGFARCVRNIVVYFFIDN